MCTSSETGKMVLVFFPDQTGWPSHVTCGHHPASFSQYIAQTGLPEPNPGLLRAHNQQTGSIYAITCLFTIYGCPRVRLFFLVKVAVKQQIRPLLPSPSLPSPFLSLLPGSFRHKHRFAALLGGIGEAFGLRYPYFRGARMGPIENRGGAGLRDILIII